VEGRQRWWAALLAVGALCPLWGTPATVLAAPPRASRAVAPPKLEALRLGERTLRLELSEPVVSSLAAVRRNDGSLARVYVDLGPETQLADGVARQKNGIGTLGAARVGRSESGQLRVAVEIAGGVSYQLQSEAGGRVLRLRVEPVAKAAPPPARDPPAPVEPPAAMEARAKPSEAAAAAARRRAEPLRPPRLKVVLDPGHGGDDPGASGYAVEKHVTLAIATRLATLIRERLDADVVLTRTDDRTLELKDRTALANAERADLFVSIHANASPRDSASGIETYLLDDTSDHATLRLAAMENGAPVARPREGETDLRYILSDLVQGGKGEDSDALARSIQRGLVSNMRRHYAGVVDLGVKRGPFYVLVGAHMPCVLVETAFLTHPIEGRRLAEEAFQERVAEGIYTGMAGFLADAARSRTL
jgi:N-acetylmuramoyl-L-alanine amidase